MRKNAEVEQRHLAPEPGLVRTGVRACWHGDEEKNDVLGACTILSSGRMERAIDILYFHGYFCLYLFFSARVWFVCYGVLNMFRSKNCETNPFDTSLRFERKNGAGGTADAIDVCMQCFQQKRFHNKLGETSSKRYRVIFR